MSMPRMTEQELAEFHRRIRISKSKTGARSSTDARRTTGNGSSCEAAIQQTKSQRGELASSPTSQTFFIPGRLPGANDIVSRQRMVYSRLKSAWGVTIARCILVAKLKRMGYCRIEFVWHEPNNRRDDDNVMFGQKFILDALRDTKIIKDDRRQFVYSLTHRVLVDKDCPGVWVTLIPLCVEVT